jgi:hypothetical protein
MQSASIERIKQAAKDRREYDSEEKSSNDDDEGRKRGDGQEQDERKSVAPTGELCRIGPAHQSAGIALLIPFMRSTAH